MFPRCAALQTVSKAWLGKTSPGQDPAAAFAALQTAGPLGHYAYLRGHYHEVRQWMDAAVTGRGTEVPAGLRRRGSCKAAHRGNIRFTGTFGGPRAG